MRWNAVIVVVLTGSLLLAEEKTRTFTVAKADEGKLPKGWTAAKTGDAEGSVWKVVADETAPSKSGFVLAQTAAGPTKLYNLCVADDTRYKDLTLSVRFKAISGKIDQGGGLVWRYKDANNYYVCRYNPLEENFRLYKVEDGKRSQLQTKETLALPAGKWCTLTITHVGDRIECTIDGTKHLEAKDATFADAGQVGLWSKADAVTYFDGLQATAK